jgi:proteasome assembly chaperone (PAC2) family protein
VPAEAPPPVPADALLGETEGYLVDAGAGVVGVVEEVVFAPGAIDPSS